MQQAWRARRHTYFIHVFNMLASPRLGGCRAYIVHSAVAAPEVMPRIGTSRAFPRSPRCDVYTDDGAGLLSARPISRNCVRALRPADGDASVRAGWLLCGQWRVDRRSVRHAGPWRHAHGTVGKLCREL